MNCPSGLLLLNKEPGLTSFEALFPVKRILGSGKAGHTGTLDKFASGLLAVLTGRALKLAPWFSSLDKEYEGTLRLGIETSTLDPEGVVVGEAPVPSREDFEKILPRFRGKIFQSPPAYSAIHIDGKRAHERARAGESLKIKERPVTIYALELLSWEPPLAAIRVRCSSGTYIRSLARDMACASGSRAHLVSLCRTRVGGFSLGDALGSNDGAALWDAIRPINGGVLDCIGLPHIYADEKMAAAFGHGKPLQFLESLLPPGPPPGPLSALGILSKNGTRLIAVLEWNKGRWTYGHVFSIF